ncbi:MAG: TatD family hydrolase [Lachnospiraceae bacterium]|nr:TatD family hydrolase [Lachnospiraceae bacterium]
MQIPYIFDTHAHYDDSSFDCDRQEVLDRILKAGVRHFVDVSSEISSMGGILKILAERPEAYGTLGVHPSETHGLKESDFILIRAKIEEEPRIVAVGEIGLDYHYDGTDREEQKKWFSYQIELARSLKKPIVVHSRDAAEDTYRVLMDSGAEEVGGVIHCFSYSIEMAEKFVEMGFYIGIGGVVTFKNAKKLKEIARRIQLGRIVLETDCPYLAPAPHRGERNDSGYLPLIAEEIASLRDISVSEVYGAAWENAHALYGL